MVQNKSKPTESVGLSSAQGDLPLVVGGWTRESARCVLGLNMNERNRKRIMRLESKAAQTRLTDGEQAELQGYEQVAIFFEFMNRSARNYLAELDLAAN